MDLGIAGRTALVCGSTRGLGRACAEALAREGVTVFINGRDAARLDEALRDLRLISAQVHAVQGDVGAAEGRRALLAACPQPDILVNNNAGPSPGQFLSFDHQTWMGAIESNMVAPIQLVQAVLPAMRERKFGRIVNITSAMVTTPRPHMTLSAGARAGLTAVMKGLSFDTARDNVTINNLLPERFDTDRQEQMARVAMQRDGISYEEARRRQVESIAARRLGRPEEFGAMCAFLCSALAGFVSGQNVHLDGGSYPALV
ncbi:MAG TPA: SDR family oxidoreductase [Phenylobacterium sp.]|uniref:SDR family oxidoreductase n=1 Tax=Phenylobacterium sp. TaxID=1871053 RepID=UPI002B47C6EC|nr:SDR family oxidoreductase [Phenylobacterium sp.]HKR86927.1 SDR family oxidoreductase [Phenylobacterium sp.]HKT54611.1 SDR family oxidoreductase [Caulobacteraceae bacterium]